MEPEDKGDAQLSEGWKFLRNIVGLGLAPIFALPQVIIVAGSVWLCKELGLSDGWVLGALLVSVPVALFVFVLTIPSILAIDSWLTRVFGVPVSEGEPALLSAMAVRRLSLLPRVTRSLWLAASVAIGLVAPIGVYLGAIALGLTNGDLRGQGLPATAVIVVNLFALIWLAPKVSRAIDRWIARWDAERCAHTESCGVRQWWLHCLVFVVYVVITFFVPFLFGVMLIFLGVHGVGWLVLIGIVIAGLANLYLVDMLAMYFMRRISIRR